MNTDTQQTQQTPPTTSPQEKLSSADFDAWAGAVKRQMIDALRKRGSR